MADDTDPPRPDLDPPQASAKLPRFFAAARQWFSQLDTLVKVAAALTTIIGVGTAAFQGYSVWQDYTLRHRTIAAYVSEADNHLNGQDYTLAWDANAKAIELDTTDEAALAQQTRIAMRWLENTSLSSKPGATKFGDIADPLLDALVRRVASPKIRSIELADIKAHIGWARFLRSRDGITGLRIAEEFTDALKTDPNNMYAHVMRGFFTLWERAPPEAARADFDAALQSDVDPPYRDRIILAALFNSQEDQYEFAAVDYTNRIRQSGRTIDAGYRRHVLTIYEQGIGDIEYLDRLSRVISFQDHIATLDWVASGETEDHRQRNDIVLKAYFLELAGNKSEALALYQQVVAAASPQTPARFVALARSGIRRLNQTPHKAPGGQR